MKPLHLCALVALGLSLSACDTLTAVTSLLPGGGDLSLLQRLEETGGVVDEKVVGNAVKAVPLYCKLPAGARSKVRGHVNGQENIGGNQIGIWCHGDPALTLGAAQ